MNIVEEAAAKVLFFQVLQPKLKDVFSTIEVIVTSHATHSNSHQTRVLSADVYVPGARKHRRSASPPSFSGQQQVCSIYRIVHEKCTYTVLLCNPLFRVELILLAIVSSLIESV